MKKTILFGLLMWLCGLFCQAQKQRNYIYVFDCTASMKDFKIYEPAKQWLKEDISRQDMDATITVVPFRDNPDNVITFERKDFDWEKLNEEFDKLISSPHSKTGICRAWDKGVDELSKNKDNYFYLLTDGEDGYDGTAALQNRMQGWCEKHPNDYGFYVSLSKDANRVLETTSINCDHFFKIDGSKHLPPFGAFTPNSITVNLQDLKPKTVGFSTSGTFKATAKSNDPNFAIELKNNEITNGKAVFVVKPKRNVKELANILEEEYQLEGSVMTDENKLYLPSNAIHITVKNRPVRNLDIVAEEQSGKATWYDRFLFWGASEQDTINIALNDTWNELAQGAGSEMKITLSCETLKDEDYSVLLNGKPQQGKTVTLKAGHENDVLGIVLATDAPEGKHYIQMKAKKQDMNKLETINDEESAVYENTIRAKYDVVWNPMKWILLIILIAIIVAIVLWLLIFKRVFFPPIKVGSINIEDPYYSKINVHGKRRLVFTNKRMSQSFLNRLFTGEIVYNVNQVWTTPLIIEAGKGKTLTARRNKDYVFDPYGSRLTSHTEYTVENVQTNERVKMTVN